MSQHADELLKELNRASTMKPDYVVAALLYVIGKVLIELLERLSK